MLKVDSEWTSENFYKAAVSLEIQLCCDSTEEEIEKVKEQAIYLLDELENLCFDDFTAKEARKNLLDTIYFYKIPQVEKQQLTIPELKLVTENREKHKQEINKGKIAICQETSWLYRTLNTGDACCIEGYAKDIKQARKMILKNLDKQTKFMIKTSKWELFVWFVPSDHKNNYAKVDYFRYAIGGK